MTHSLADRRQAVQLKTAAPTFVVADVAATARWYAEALGFRIAGTVPARQPYVYASLQRGGVELMLLSLAGYKKPDLTALRPDGIWDAYVRMRGVRSFYSRLEGQPFIRMPLKKQPYGEGV